MNWNVIYVVLLFLQLSLVVGDIEQQATQMGFDDNIMLRDSNNYNINDKSKSHVLEKSVTVRNNKKELSDIGGKPVKDIQDKVVDNMSDESNYEDSNDGTSTLSLTDQVLLLSKQLNALTLRRREDYKILENSLKKSLRKSISTGSNGDVDIRTELEELREEVRAMREGGIGNKQRLTVEWLTQSIAEMRKELTELQEIANNASKGLTRHSQIFEDIATITSDFSTFKLELEALKQRQEKTEVFVQELRDEAVQKEEDLQRMLKQRDQNGGQSMEYVEPEADHKMRHHRFLRQQVHDLELAQKRLKHQLNEFQFHRISDRVRNLELEQHRIANANFNLTRQIAGLDKLHGSMLELLEDVEGIQNKIDKSIPDIKHEISKLEFTSAQLNSEQSLLREEGHNAVKSIQALAVSVSVLQEERENIRNVQDTIEKLQKDVQQLKSGFGMNQSNGLQQHVVEQKTNETNEAEGNAGAANNLVKQLESVELQYESIINKLPEDCSQVDHTASGLYLIAPSGQHHPTLVSCNSGWTLVQRRYDGSVDFNRSWESYAQGFGGPSGEFWVGNEILHHLTADNCTELRITMQDIYDNTWFASYSNFYVSDRNDGYRLHISGYSGNASDALDYQNRMQFSAIDVDRDISNTHCAANYEGGWWFSHCQHANLNGRYNLGLTWFDASRNEWIAVKSSQMMITKNIKCLNSLTKDRTTTIISTVV